MAKRNSIRTNDPAGMRNRVLDVAARSFQVAGYGATSMHDIVRAAAVSGGALYHHFPTKKHLALAVIAERVSTEVGETWVCSVCEAASAGAGILSVFETVIAALDEAGVVNGCPLGNLAIELSLVDEQMRGAVVAQYGIWRDAIADRLRADAAPYAPDPDAFATMVVAMFSGAMAIARTEQSTAALRACADQLAVLMQKAPAG